MRTRLSLVTLISLALTSPALAGDAHLTLKTLNWDPRQPDATPYIDVARDGDLAKVIDDSWAEMRASIVTSVTAALGQKQLQSGVSLYNLDLHFPDKPDPYVLSAGGTTGVLRLSLPQTTLEFKATTPVTSRDTDPRLRVTFDVAVDVAFRLNGKMNPPLEIVAATSHSSNVKVSELNATAGIASIVSEIESGITNGPTLTDMITTGVQNTSRNITGSVASNLRKNTQRLQIPAGFQYNGGAVEKGRITIAAWKMMPLPNADVPVLVTWDTKYGRIIPNCDPVQLKVSLPYAPPPYGETKHIDTDNYPSATTASMPLAAGFGCTQSISGAQGVSGTLKYKEWVVESGHPRTPGMSYTVRAVNVHVPDPIVVGDASRGKAQLKLDVREGIHDGSRQLDKAQEILGRTPGDPVERSVNPAVNNAAQRNVLPAASVTNAPRVADDLNPQPLPPGPSDRKAAGAARVVPPAQMNGAPPSSLTGR